MMKFFSRRTGQVRNTGAFALHSCSLWRGIIIIACSATITTLHAQNVGKISGVVKDAETGELLIGCNVHLVGTTFGASTDLEGSFFILNIPPGKYDIQASMVGYQRVIQRDAIVNAGRTTVADFSLRSTALAQQEVIVQATRPDVEKEKTSTSAIVRSEEVQTLAGIRDVGDVLMLAADVTDGHFRGGRAGEEYYTLQGMGIVNPLDNTSAFLPIMSAVEEVEVITSGFGAQYGNAQSGVVNISMKEGKSDKWSTRIETRTRAPGRKHFGPSAYDPGANPYLAILLGSDIWLQGDPESQSGGSYVGSMGSGLPNAYARDPAVQLAVARTLWKVQTRRDLYRNYGRDMDFSAEVGTGGPIDKNLRLFVALRTNNEWPVFPTENPNTQKQVMGNIAIDLPGAATLRFSGGFTQENNNVFPSINNYTGYESWLWDRITAINYQDRTNLQVGGRFTEALSNSTFYEIKLSTLRTRTQLGSTPAPYSVSDSLVLNNEIRWSTILPVVNNNSPDKIQYQGGRDAFRNELTQTVSLDGAITSQITNSHLVTAGIQANSYKIDVSNVFNVYAGIAAKQDYRATPFEGAVYVQDKMEFEGLIANLGIRFDLWNSASDHFTNQFSPYLMADSLGIFHPENAPRQKAPILGRLQPRAGISFPISVNTVFHLNYGSFMQRPSFQYVVASRVTQGYGSPIILGNPRLEPETTNSYDIGVTQGLGDGFTIDLSGYYKDVKNLVQQATFSGGGATYSTFFNRDYADIRGFRLALNKRRGDLTGSINYHYSVATGKSATVSNATPAFTIDQTTGEIYSDLTNVPIRDIRLDFDRTHNLVVNVGYATSDEWGPEIFGIRPFADAVLSVSSFARSGRPYTSPSNPTFINGARTPGEYNTNVKLSKRVRSFFGTNATFYIEVFNLFNNKILNYDYIFQTGSLSTPNPRIAAYEKYGINDPKHGIRYWWDTEKQGPFAVDQSFLIYSNAPRAFSFGLAVDL
ncbi:MAG: TonB-dependent receptor [Bacteroidetes bacterium]|nr:TonB-dependent receptor [Bacteroidota bacterium]MCW5894106.1 TonB-dependent receptor [Bacteroidota bacterium]